MNKTRKHTPAHWAKHALRYQSHPEEVIAAAARVHFNGSDEHGIAFDGSAHELLNLLYTEHRRNMRCVHWGLFPTPMHVARRLAELLDLGPHRTVFDPGAGLGNLLAAAMERGARAHGMECQAWLVAPPDPLLPALGFDVIRGDFLDFPQAVRPFDTVMVNPPFGRIGSSSDATTDFMARLADIAPPHATIGAILPKDHFARGPKARMAVAARFRIHDTLPLNCSTFKPLTNIATAIHIMSLR